MVLRGFHIKDVGSSEEDRHCIGITPVIGSCRHHISWTDMAGGKKEGLWVLKTAKWLKFQYDVLSVCFQA